ncbi:MAG TPA: DUF1272 domain-containing protein [Sneathiellales bacterium]|nr:DUF1272 domain-containing protein [Sneathiellales bacterium]
MALEIRPECERCQTLLPAEAATALICSYECTFCSACGEYMDGICPNCQGQLLPRPAGKARSGA